MNKVILMLCFLLFVTCFFILSIRNQGFNQANNQTNTLIIDFLDIGQGDATFFTFPDGRQMLVDCAIDARVLEALGRVMPVYDKSIDYLMITHPDLDHYGGCIDVLDRFDVGHIIVNGTTKQNQMAKAIEEAIQQEEAGYTIIDRIQTWDIASTRIDFLYPTQDLQQNPKIPGTDEAANSNDSSIVFLLEYAGVRMLFPGDAEKDLEYFLAEAYGEEMDVDILKVSHHGGQTSSIQPFLDATKPTHSIISSGKKNHFGHPSRRVLKRLERVGSEIWRTDQMGDVRVEVENNGNLEIKID